MLTEGAKCTGVRFGGKIQDSEKILSHAFLRRQSMPLDPMEAPKGDGRMGGA